MLNKIMENFRKWLAEHEESHLATWLERSAEEIVTMAGPKEGTWVDKDTYSFNVEGEDKCSDRDGDLKFCYKVRFVPIEGKGVGISFDRAGSYADLNMGSGQAVFDGVRKAVGEYITKNKPEVIYWSPAQRMQTGFDPVKNPTAREKVYEIWSIKALWPDLYVSPEVNKWVRRDVYDSKYVKEGYPPVPANASKTTKSLNEFRVSVSGINHLINRLLFWTDGFHVYHSDPKGNLIEYRIGMDGKWEAEPLGQVQIKNLSQKPFSLANSTQVMDAASALMSAGVKQPLNWFPDELVQVYKNPAKLAAHQAAKGAKSAAATLANAVARPLDAASSAYERMMQAMTGKGKNKGQELERI
jgi:hypothetical protein